MNSCWVPNRRQDDCELMHNLPHPISGYCDRSMESKKQCVNECVHKVNYTLLQNCKEKMLDEKYCTHQDCIDTCNNLSDPHKKMQCELYCNQTQFMKPSDYDYLFYCKDATCSRKCQEALRCRFDHTFNLCQLQVCGDSCKYLPRDSHLQCSPSSKNQYCLRYTPHRPWHYHYNDASFAKEKCEEIDHELYHQTIGKDRIPICKRGTGFCRWTCVGGDKKPAKKCEIKGGRCYETKKNCCRNHPRCMMLSD